MKRYDTFPHYSLLLIARKTSTMLVLTYFNTLCFRQPLHWAAAMGRDTCVDLLLKLGADPNIHDIETKNALHYAKQAAHSGN